MIRVLALIPGGLSDQLLFFPTLDQLAQQYPSVQVDVIVEPRAKAAYRLSPVVDKVVPFNFAGRTGPADWGNLIGVGRDRTYDLVLYTGTSPLIGTLIWLMGTPQRIAFTGQANFLYSHVVPRESQSYLAHQYHHLLCPVGLDQQCPALQITIPEPDLTWADTEYQRLGLTDTGFGLLHGGIHPRTSTTEIYPLNSWLSVVQGWQDRRPDLPLVVIVDPQNPEWSTPLLNQAGNLLVSTPTDLGKLAALIDRAQVLICPDSAPMHLGVAVGTKVVALFGHGQPQQYLPESESSIGLKAATSNIGDIPPIQVLETLT